MTALNSSPDPTLRNFDEEEQKQEEYEDPNLSDSDSHHDHHWRHDYNYARETSPNGLARKATSRSQREPGLNALGRLRSRRRDDPQNTNQFNHTLTHTKTGPDVLVDFEGKDDPYRPINWPFRKKAVTTVMYGLTTAGITFASSVYSADVQQIAEEFHVGTEVSTLGIVRVVFWQGVLSGDMRY